MFSFSDMLRRLTDNYAKSPQSNMGKIIAILYEQLKTINDTLDRIRDWKDIDQAKGKTLDLIGDNVVQPRGVARDEVYRVLIKSKIARNLSRSDINTIIRVIALALDCQYSDIVIKETFSAAVAPEPCGISLIQIPIRRLNEVGMDPYQFARIVQKTVAAGVSVKSIELSGTFEFASGPGETDAGAGFSDLTQEIGGYFGVVYSPSEDRDLPI